MAPGFAAIPGKLELTTPSDREIVMTRVFDAPRRLVYDAVTKPELVRRWLGVFNEHTMSVCEIDLRVGGKYRYVWSTPNAPDMGMGGVFRELVEPENWARMFEIPELAEHHRHASDVTG